MSTNYNLAENRESGIPLCNSNHPGNVSRCTVWKAASLEVALTHHDLEPCEGDFAIWQPGLAPWPGFQPRGSQSPVLRQCGLWIVLWVSGCLWGNSPNESYGSPGALVSSYHVQLGRLYTAQKHSTRGATVKDAVLYAFMRWSI